MRLAGGQIEQEGRPEVCINGVWGSICGYGWSELDGFMFCEELGYTEPGTGWPLLCELTRDKICTIFLIHVYDYVGLIVHIQW